MSTGEAAKDISLEHIAAELLQCAENDELDRAKQLMEGRSREERTAIARRRSADGRTHLLSAVSRRSVAFVNFLLDE